MLFEIILFVSIVINFLLVVVVLILAKDYVLLANCLIKMERMLSYQYKKNE